MILTSINGIPLYSTLQEARTWATANRTNGYHTHVFNGQIGYMGGSTHSNAIQTTTTTSTIVRRNPTSSSGSSGGGGY